MILSSLPTMGADDTGNTINIVSVSTGGYPVLDRWIVTTEELWAYWRWGRTPTRAPDLSCHTPIIVDTINETR